MTPGPAIIVLAAGLGSRFQDAGHKQFIPSDKNDGGTNGVPPMLPPGSPK